MSINYPDQMFDAVICSHVLEHVSDDLKAMKELHRVMKNDGWGIMQVPIALNLQKTNEDPNIVTPEHRFQAFGQEDRVRIYAKGDFVQRLESVGFTVNQIHFAQKYGIAEIMKYGLSQKDILYIVTKKTVSKGSDVPVVSDESNKVSWHYKLFIIWKNIVKKIGGIVKKDR